MDNFSYDELVEGFEYLDDLRQSGVTNMWGAAAYMVDELAWPKSQASAVLILWMNSFDGESTIEERVRKVLENV